MFIQNLNIDSVGLEVFKSIVYLVRRINDSLTPDHNKPGLVDELFEYIEDWNNYRKPPMSPVMYATVYRDVNDSNKIKVKDVRFTSGSYVHRSALSEIMQENDTIKLLTELMNIRGVYE